MEQEGIVKQNRRRPVRRRKRRKRYTPVIFLICAAALFYGGFAVRGALTEEATLPAAADETTAPPTAHQQPATDSPLEKPNPNAWNLRLVNQWHPLTEDYEITLKELANDHAIDERCYSDLQEMMDDCRAAGLTPVICSSYRAWEDQMRLYQNKVDEFLAQGFSQAQAELEAGKIVAVPGTSEHQLGLALDIVDINNQRLDHTQEETAVQKWLLAHSWEYGFILRYPNEKSEITGIIYEPWHYRYVGREAAAKIHNMGVCLEEYLEEISG